MCVPFIINQTPAAGGEHCHGPQRTALSGLWAIPSTESGPQYDVGGDLILSKFERRARLFVMPNTPRAPNNPKLSEAG